MTPSLLLLVIACSDYVLQHPDDVVDGADDTATPDTADTGSDTGDDSPVDSGTDTGDPTEEMPNGRDPVVPDADDPLDGWSGTCAPYTATPQDVPFTEACDDFGIGAFEPVVEWTLGAGQYSRATVAVGDLDGDEIPEVVANVTGLFGRGSLVVAHGDGSGILWTRAADLGYAASPAIADLDFDGHPEILAVREYASSLLATGDYTVVVYDAEGNLRWESAHFDGDDFDYGTAISVSDMDHDGAPEVIAGRVIFRWNGTTRGVGNHGRGSIGGPVVIGMDPSEAAVSAVADLDLDGVEEVITGNAMYSPDGTTLWYDGSLYDGMVAVGNLDADPEGEFVAVSREVVRAHDTDGSLLWGPFTVPTANILSPPAIADIDGDGAPEILVAGGNSLLALEADGSTLWEVAVTDETGATGASVFDFEGDGIPEVVYIDEVEMMALDGATGAVKFHSTDHQSDTMYDYPVIADVDADGHAEIVVAHAGSGVAISIYGDATDSWAPARKVWNQHAYCITNVNDDLTVPIWATPGFEAYNRWHSALDRPAGEPLVDDLGVEILDICGDDCANGSVFVSGRVLNRAEVSAPPGIAVTLYARLSGAMVPVDARITTASIPPGRTGPVMTFVVDATTAAAASALRLRVDDNGSGSGAIAECNEANNTAVAYGSWCD